MKVFISYTIFFLTLTYIIENFASDNPLKLSRKIVVVLTGTLFTFCINLLRINIIISMPVIFFIYYFAYGSGSYPIKKHIIIFVLAMVSIVAINQPIEIAIRDFLSDTILKADRLILQQMLVYIAIHIIYWRVNLQTLKNLWTYKIAVLELVILNSLILPIGSYILKTNELDMVSKVFFLIFLVLLNVRLMNVIIKQNKEKRDDTVSRVYLPFVDTAIERLKSDHYDINEQLKVINSMITSNTDLRVKKYIDDIHQNYQSHGVLFISNKVIVGLLESKLIEAEDKCIHTIIDIKNRDFSSNIRDYELVEMYNLVISNAINALEKEEKKNLAIEINYRDGVNMFTVTRSIKTDEAIEFMEEYKNVSTLRGKYNNLGLYKLKKAIKKNKGQLNFNYNGRSNELSLELLHS